MAKPPKLANIETDEDLSHWLADTIQQQVSKENAGFVQIVRGPKNDLVLSNGKKDFAVAIEGLVGE